ncbi:LysE family translocator [bacterium]|nr:LysE family translocator [bacterium]
MDNLLSIFIFSFTISLTGALAPGPLLTSVIAKSPVYGFRTGPLIIIGHAIVEVLVVVAIILGPSHFIQNPISIRTISLIGGGILIFLGVGMLRSNVSLSFEKDNSLKKLSGLPFLGITITLSNPYWVLWWFTVGVGLVLSVQKLGIIAIIVFFLGHILADTGWYSLVSFILSKGNKFFSNKVYRIIMKICGVTLAGFGIYFIRNFFKTTF